MERPDETPYTEFRLGVSDLSGRGVRPDLYRRGGLRRLVLTAEGMPSLDEPPRLDQDHLRRVLRDAISAVLTPAQRAAVEARLEGVTYVEAARTLGVDPDALRKRYELAERKLRKVCLQSLESGVRPCAADTLHGQLALPAGRCPPTPELGLGDQSRPVVTPLPHYWGGSR